MQEVIEGQVGMNDETFKYQLLSRLKMDCEYFLGFGNRSEHVLWSGTVEDHIADMKALWNDIKTGKPEWLTYEDILKYEKEMK